MIEDRRYLDLFGGTGAVGIEALSRGARRPSSASATAGPAHALQRNLATHRAGRGRARWYPAMLWLPGAPRAGALRRHLHAPPQYQGLWLNALQQVDARPDLLAEDGLASRPGLPEGMAGARTGNTWRWSIAASTAALRFISSRKT